MIVKKEEATERPIIIDLTGPEGNAFVLLGYAKTYAKQLSLNWEYIRDQMKAGDYENLIKAFDSHFGEFVTLMR
jgi:hypothetical protein